jgi:hypothetical protein
MKDLPHDNTVD